MSEAKVFKVADLYHSCNGDALVVDAEVHHAKLAASLAANESLSAELAWSENDSRDQSKEIAVLREELAESGRADHLRQRIAFLTAEVHARAEERDAALERLADAERRNAELVELLQRVVDSGALVMEQDASFELESLEADICAALTKPEEAKS